MLIRPRRGSIYKAYDANLASKRPHLSNPMCSVSGTWGIKIQDKKSASKMPHIRLYDISPRRKVCLSAAVLYPVHCCAMVYPQLCGIFEADVSAFIYTPCSADAAHGVTEMRPLRGQNRRNRNSKPPGCALANTASSTRKHGHLRYHMTSLFITNTAFGTRKCTIYVSSNTAFTKRKRAACYGATQESGRQSVTGKGRIWQQDW